MEQDLKIIKKKYGENMAKLCREFFPTLLETEGLLSTLMLNHFEPNHKLCQDLIDQEKEIEFKNYIYSLVGVENEEKVNSQKSPKELLSEVGYDLYECKTEEEIQSFKKYYAKDEELCTFRGGRLNSCRVFFAVKKDVDEIKREDYPHPQRQDKYGTSVISIQFMKDYSHTLSIKNRYNHKVNNPDSTFSNNLDNIINGLTKSFEREYGLIQQHKNKNFEIKGYVRANDGKFYKYNQEANNIYYCPNNIIIDNFEVNRYEKEKYIIMDCFILDLVNKKIKLYDERLKDAFLDTIGDIEKLEIERQEKEKLLILKVKNNEDIKLVLNENNEMIKLTDPNIEKIGDKFLSLNTALQELTLPNVKEVGKYFLYYNDSLQKLDLPNVRIVGNSFLSMDDSLKEINLPNLQEVGSYFLHDNKSLQVLTLPNLTKTGNNFLYMNDSLQKLILPKLQKVGSYCLYTNNSLQEVNLPNLRIVGDDFLYYNGSLQVINLPSLQEVGKEFLNYNTTLQNINCPNLDKIGKDFLFEHPVFNETNFKNNNNIVRSSK